MSKIEELFSDFGKTLKDKGITAETLMNYLIEDEDGNYTLDIDAITALEKEVQVSEQQISEEIIEGSNPATYYDVVTYGNKSETEVRTDYYDLPYSEQIEQLEELKEEALSLSEDAPLTNGNIGKVELNNNNALKKIRRKK